MPTMSPTPWIDEAYKFLGKKELPGAATAPFIASWLVELGAWWRDDETPWCGTTVAHCLKATGFPVSKEWYRAKDWLNYGTKLSKPAFGCIVVFERKGGGHVGFVVGLSADGTKLAVLGGNQDNGVCIREFPIGNAVGYRYPATAKTPDFTLKLPTVASVSSKTQA